MRCMSMLAASLLLAPGVLHAFTVTCKIAVRGKVVINGRVATGERGAPDRIETPFNVSCSPLYSSAPIDYQIEGNAMPIRLTISGTVNGIAIPEWKGMIQKGYLDERGITREDFNKPYVVDIQISLKEDYSGFDVAIIKHAPEEIQVLEREMAKAKALAARPQQEPQAVEASPPGGMPVQVEGQMSPDMAAELRVKLNKAESDNLNLKVQVVDYKAEIARLNKRIKELEAENLSLKREKSKPRSASLPS